MIKLIELKERFRKNPDFFPVKNSEIEGMKIGDSRVLWHSVIGRLFVDEMMEIEPIQREANKEMRKYLVRAPSEELLKELEEVWMAFYLKSDRNFAQYDCAIFLSAICAIEGLLQYGPDAHEKLQSLAGGAANAPRV